MFVSSFLKPARKTKKNVKNNKWKQKKKQKEIGRLTNRKKKLDRKHTKKVQKSRFYNLSIEPSQNHPIGPTH